MRIRKNSLPPGWHPGDGESIKAFVTESLGGDAEAGRADGAMAPHAGWAYSGRLAAKAWASLREADTVAVIGGHRGPGSPILIASEDGFDTPLGLIEADLELRDLLKIELGLAGIRHADDAWSDNTVEVQLPFLRFFMPQARLLWLRAPADESSIVLGRLLADLGRRAGRRLAAIGSTDLTHYGPDYGFEPEGRGPAAESWVREVNDRGFLEALLRGDARAAIEHAELHASACSAGGAAAALAFAQGSGAERPRLIEYATSLELRRAASFVGYAAMAFE